MFRNTVLLFVLTVATPVLDAADWPAWRGPTGQGFSEEQDALLDWSDSENVKWKIPLE